MFGQTLWSMPREEYAQRFGEEAAIALDNFQPLVPPLLTHYDELGQAYREDDECPPQTRFPLPVDDSEIEQALQEIDWFGITKASG